jgi:hypothetical protein
MIRSIVLLIPPSDTTFDHAALERRMAKLYPAATISRREHRTLGAEINGGACELRATELEEQRDVLRAVSRETRLLAEARAPLPAGDEDVEGAIREVRESTRFYF